MKKILALVVVVLVLTGCNKELTITEVKMDKVSGEIGETIENIERENGNYIIHTENEQYVFLNRINVMEGEDAVVLSNFKTEVKENVLYVSFEEAVDSGEDGQHKMLYKIKGGDDDFDTIDLIGNGESVHFDAAIIK